MGGYRGEFWLRQIGSASCLFGFPRFAHFLITIQSHVKGFNQGPGGQEYGSVIQGAVKGDPHVRHYQMYDPTPIDPGYECVEFCEFPLKPGMTFADFYAAWAPLLKRVSAYDGCPYAALGQGIEDPQAVVQIQPWKTYDSHMIGFRQSPQVEQVMEPFHPVAARFFVDGWAGAKSGHVMLTPTGEAVLEK